MKKIHEFDNGIKVFDHQLLEEQRERYRRQNVHEEDEERLFVSIIESLPEGSTYVNIGTAIGYYPLLAKRLRSDLRIHCFEPLPRHLEFFRENVALNGFEEGDFMVHPVAISTRSGKAAFLDNSYGSSLSAEENEAKPGMPSIKGFLARFFTDRSSDAGVRVDCLQMREIFKRIGGGRIDFLQMDIQGFEEPVLRAYFAGPKRLPGQIARLLVGTHGAEIHQACKDCLETNGYGIEHDEPETEHQPDGILLGLSGRSGRS